MTTMIKADNLCKTYIVGVNSVEVLKNISIEIYKGEFVSVMGHSGSGKSTLLYLLGALDKASSGRIWIDGKEITTLRDREESRLRRRKIGFVFQFYNLVPNMTVEENILLPVLLDGKKGKSCSAKVKELLFCVGLENRRRHTPRELSGGEQQRVAIARALINDPEIILADEPIGNLDSKTGMGILELLSGINRDRNKTIIMVTHSQESTLYTQRVIRLKDGEVVE